MVTVGEYVQHVASVHPDVVAANIARGRDTGRVYRRIGLLIGPAGLLAERFKRDPALVDEKRTGMDTAFIAMLFLTSLTGMALLLWRDTAAMGPLLALHLGVVFSLFITMPYGKFVHGIYRYVALVRYAKERRMAGHV